MPTNLEHVSDLCLAASVTDIPAVGSCLNKANMLSLTRSQRSSFCLDLPLSMRVWLRRAHALSHGGLWAAAVNSPQVLPCLFRNLPVVSPCSCAQTRVHTHTQIFTHNYVSQSENSIRRAEYFLWSCTRRSNSPCFNCAWPPFITAILLLSIGPGGSNTWNTEGRRLTIKGMKLGTWHENRV